MSPTLTRSVPFFNYPHVFSSQEAELISVFRDVGRRGAFIMQRDLAAFERNLASFVGAKHAVGVDNATDGLTIALRASGIQPGDEVIICSHTMIATASSIHFAGATPVPVEAGPDHLIDAAAIERAITKRTRALMPTQLNGRTCNMDALRAIADRHGLLILEDAAQALGSKFKGRSAGTFGLAAAISFYPAKVLGCLGDGGAVLTSDDSLYERLIQLRDHGRDSSGEIVSWGMNTRLDNLQAAILDMELAKYPAVISRRREIAGIYDEQLSEIAQLTLPPGPESNPHHFDIFQNYEIEADRRDDLQVFLRDNGVGSLVQWNGQPVHQCRKLGFTQDLPYTDKLFRRALMLPINMSLEDDDVRYVCDVVRGFYRR